VRRHRGTGCGKRQGWSAVDNTKGEGRAHQSLALMENMSRRTRVRSGRAQMLARMGMTVYSGALVANGYPPVGEGYNNHEEQPDGVAQGREADKRKTRLT
jgi:hypothetical protein